MVWNTALWLTLWLPQLPAAAAWVSHSSKIDQRCLSRSPQNKPLVSKQTITDSVSDTLDRHPVAPSTRNQLPRRTFATSFLLPSLVATAAIMNPESSNALVKGNAPPPKTKPGSSTIKCTNVEECQALAEQQADLDRQEALANLPPASVTSGGTRYRDLALGDESSMTVTKGMQVTLFYKVLKLGKRSYDGLSGEGTVVFSRGYGLEDDEDKAGVKTFVTTVGSPLNIEALNEALIGMHVGGTRRFSVLPQKGWRKPGDACDGGPGGKGQGGDLKTDYLVVPTATMVALEACFDQTKQPFPASFAQQRRMAQRFDQSLIMEVQVVSIGPSGGL